MGQWPPQALTVEPARQPGPRLGTHLKRAIDWNVAEIVVTPRERAALVAAQVEPRLHGLFAWRRSTLLVSLPLVLLSIVLSFWGAYDGLHDKDAQAFAKYVTPVGFAVIYAPSIALLFIPLAIVVAVGRWTQLRQTSRFLMVCYAASIVVPLLAALVPVQHLLDIDAISGYLGDNGATSGQIDDAVLSVRLGLAINYALSLLPVIISVPGGVLKGASRIKSLFPSSPLPGWFLVSVAPFYSMFTVVVFVLLDQIIGNMLLLVGVALLAFTPWLFVIYRKVYTRPLGKDEARGELARASRLGGYFMIGAIGCIVVFMFTARVGHKDVLGWSDATGYFSYKQVLGTIAESFGRGLVSTVVFSAAFVSMVFAEWRITSSLRADLRAEHDAEMRALQHYVDAKGGIATQW